MRKFDETADVHSRRQDAGEPWLVISSAAGVRTIPLPRAPKITIGRMPTCDIVIDDESVSRQHAVIHNTPPNLLIEDLGSRNRTKILGRALGRGDSAVLAVGTVVEIGYASMFVQVGRPAAAPASAAPSTKAAPVVRDPTMQRLYALLDIIAPSPLNVLILGETGTGKEVFAEAIHRGSTRANAPFLKINCAALSGSILESELFGHERGAFTGAIAQKSGLFEAADGGTVFLDEIGELPLETQAKLLRVVEYGEVIRLGSVTPKRVNVRYVAATNRDLNQGIVEQRFRSDLFFRLNGFSVTLPPLRKRKKDIEPLAHHFLARAAQGRQYTLLPDALAALDAYPWPGNIRELKNVLERAFVLSGPSARIDTSHLQLPNAPPPQSDAFDVRGPSDTLPPMPSAGQQMMSTAGGSGGADLRAQRDSFEKQQILQALEKTSGNQKEAAKLLGVSRRTLINKIEAYGIARPRKR